MKVAWAPELVGWASTTLSSYSSLEAGPVDAGGRGEACGTAPDAAADEAETATAEEAAAAARPRCATGRPARWAEEGEAAAATAVASAAASSPPGSAATAVASAAASSARVTDRHSSIPTACAQPVVTRDSHTEAARSPGTISVMDWRGAPLMGTWDGGNEKGDDALVVSMLAEEAWEMSSRGKLPDSPPPTLVLSGADEAADATGVDAGEAASAVEKGCLPIVSAPVNCCFCCGPREFGFGRAAPFLSLNPADVTAPNDWDDDAVV